MIDNFQQDIEKFNRLEKILKLDIKTREDLCKKNESTTMVLYKLNCLINSD